MNAAIVAAGAAAAAVVVAGAGVDFEDLRLEGDSRAEERLVIHRPDNARVVFSAIPYFGFTDAAVGPVKNHATSACVDPEGSDVKLGSGRGDMGFVGMSGFAIRADFEPPLGGSGVAFVGAEFQTGLLVEVRLQLFGASGELLGETTGRGTKAEGACGRPGGPRTRVALEARARGTVSHAVLDAEPWLVKPVGHVFVVDHVRFGTEP